MNGRIRLAVVDDSAFVRKAMRRLIAPENDIEIVGLAASGEELLEHLDDWKPTAVTLDLSMPGIGGLATLERILAWRRIPVVILSGDSTREAPMAVEALSRGAADFVDKQDFSLMDFQALRGALLEKLRVLCLCGGQALLPVPSPVPPSQGQARVPVLHRDLVVIGASTGGPPAIERLLEGLGAAPPVPIVIVQHMPAGFTTAFAERLNARLPFPVEEAAHNRPLLPGRAYIAPADVHLRVRSDAGGLVASLGRYPETQHRPSVDILFQSAAELAPRVVGVLLTGMGDDGARGLLDLAARGALTIAQDEASSIVYGMPRAAVELGAVAEQLPITGIAPRLLQLLARPLC
jgi:two-component system, chemotaxis family, protein-glutamate methylesterase/glutaminase